MAKKLDKILVIDVEATCWEEKTPPLGQESEIIEIGLCVLNVETGEREEKESILIKPERSTVSDFCTELTTLTAEDLKYGLSFRDACKLLKTKYLSQDRIFASFGDYDRRQFERQCASFKVGYPFGTTHLNVKNLAALHLGLSIEAGMPTVLAKMKLPLEGTHHRGGDDAWNIAAILAELMKELKKK